MAPHLHRELRGDHLTRRRRRGRLVNRLRDACATGAPIATSKTIALEPQSDSRQRKLIRSQPGTLAYTAETDLPVNSPHLAPLSHSGSHAFFSVCMGLCCAHKRRRRSHSLHEQRGIRWTTIIGQVKWPVDCVVVVVVIIHVIVVLSSCSWS